MIDSLKSRFATAVVSCINGVRPLVWIARFASKKPLMNR